MTGTLCFVNTFSVFTHHPVLTNVIYHLSESSGNLLRQAKLDKVIATPPYKNQTNIYYRLLNTINNQSIFVYGHESGSFLPWLSLPSTIYLIPYTP